MIFCPSCGNQMSDNAKFCMECGAKLTDFSSGGVKINDNVIQKSQVGVASVGNVNISPVISNYNDSSLVKSDKDLCPKCGFKMKIVNDKFKVAEAYCNDIIVAIYAEGQKLGQLCIKCGYKYLDDPKFISKCYCLDEYFIYRKEAGMLSSGGMKCTKCGKWWSHDEFMEKTTICLKKVDLKNELINLGWDVKLLQSFHITNKNIDTYTSK